MQFDEQAALRGSGRNRIAAVRQHAIRLIEDLGPLPGAAATFRGKIGGNAVLELETEDGATGLAPGIDPALLDAFRACLVGRPLFPLAGRLDDLRQAAGGAFDRNVASAEIAMWDIVGKLLDQPLYRLWGGDSGRVLAYSSTIGRGASIDERVDLAVRTFEEGWQAIKLRPHWETIEQDVELVERVRAATSDAFVILCDANQARGRNLSGISWDLDRAIGTARAYQELGVGWLEEPLARTDLAGLSALNAAVEMPLAGGENNVDLADFRDYGSHDCFDFWQPEVMLTGPARLFKIAAVAEAFGATVVPHEGYQSLGTVCQMHIGAALRSPYVEVMHNPPVGSYRHYFVPYLNAPSITADGYLELSERPGLGVELDRDLIEATF